MKPIATAFGICALVLAPAVAGTIDYDWDDGGRGHGWATENNWDRNSGCPNDPDDTATVASTSDDWPVLNADYTGANAIGALTMGGSAVLYLNDHNLAVTDSGEGDGDFEVSASATVTITNSSANDRSVTAKRVVINGGSTLTVSHSGDGTATVQTN